MRIATIKRMEKLVDKLGDEVLCNLHPFENREVADEDRVLIENIGEMLRQANNSLLDLKIRNKSVSAKVQKKLEESLLILRPQYRGCIFTKAVSETNIELILNSVAFGGELGVNEDWEDINERHTEITQDHIGYRTRNNQASARCDTILDEEIMMRWGPQVKVSFDFCSWGEQGGGLSMSLTYSKKWSNDREIDRNIQELSGMYLRYIDRLSAKL